MYTFKYEARKGPVKKLQIMASIVYEPVYKADTYKH